MAVFIPPFNEIFRNTLAFFDGLPQLDIAHVLRSVQFQQKFTLIPGGTVGAPQGPSLRQLPSKGGFQRAAQFPQPLHVPVVEFPVRHGRDVQIQTGVVTHGVQIRLHQPLHGMGRFLRVIEPAGADGHIHLRAAEVQPGRAGDLLRDAQIFLRVINVVQLICPGHIPRPRPGLGLRGQLAQLVRHHGPFAPPGPAGLVADPTNVRPAVLKNDGVRLIFPRQTNNAGKVIHLLAAVGAFTARAIQPDAENIAVFRQKLGKLIAEIVVVLRRAVIF